MKYPENNLLTLITALFIGFIVLSFYIRYKFTSLHEKNLEKRSKSGMSGCEIARYLLQQLDIDIEINLINVRFNGSYDPAKKTINLSREICNSYSLSALSVTAHEIGHVLQDVKDYKLLKFLIKIYPIADFGASMSWVLIVAGLLVPQFSLLFPLGVTLLLIAMFYQIFQLPLEIDASNRAIKLLVKYKLISKEELDTVSKMLDYAALSFLADPANLFFQLFNKVKRGS